MSGWKEEDLFVAYAVWDYRIRVLSALLALISLTLTITYHVSSAVQTGVGHVVSESTKVSLETFTLNGTTYLDVQVFSTHPTASWLVWLQNSSSLFSSPWYSYSRPLSYPWRTTSQAKILLKTKRYVSRNKVAFRCTRRLPRQFHCSVSQS